MVREKSSGNPTAAQKLGKTLKTARTKRGMTLRAAEALTGITNSYISQLESGHVQEPSVFKLASLAKAYGVDYGILFDAVGYPRP